MAVAEGTEERTEERCRAAAALAQRAERAIVNLKVLGRLEVGERLGCRGGVLTARASSPWAALARFMRAESRLTSLKAVEALVDEALSVCEALLASKYRAETAPEETTPALTLWAEAALLRQLTESLEQSLGGMRNMASTYEGDASAAARIELALEKARLCVATLRGRGPGRNE